MNNLQYVNCNICRKDDTSQVVIQNNYKVVQCRNCGLIYVNPQPAKKALLELYENYHKRDGKNEHTWAQLMKRNFKKISTILNEKFPDRGKMLDIGCGYGHFIEIMKDYGWSVTGVDPSSKTIGFAMQKGLKVVETTIEQAEFHEGSFDAVTAFYVLEHLFDPLSALKKIYVILKPGGIAVLRVPHTTPIIKLLALFGLKNNLYDLPFHLYDFSPKTIKLLLEKAGFSSIRIIPGCPTLPKDYCERAISLTVGNLANVLFTISMGKLLIPGTSKTIIASKACIR